MRALSRSGRQVLQAVERALDRGKVCAVEGNVVAQAWGELRVWLNPVKLGEAGQ
jgi:hypothetical protein